MPLGIAQLRAFVAVLDAGGFGAAAQTLGVSQSAISHSVAALERVVGRPVLSRDPRPAPTLFGARILDHARAVLASVSAIQALTDSESGQLNGRVTVAAMPTACQALLPELMVRWRAELPGVAVSLFEGEDEEVAAWLAGGSADLAVLVNPASSAGVLIGTDEFHAVLRVDHPLAGEPSVDLTDLADDPFLLSAGGCEPFIRELHRLAGAPFSPVHQVSQTSTLFDMVRAGVGVTVVPGLAGELCGPGLLLVPLRQRLTRNLVLAGPTHRPWHPAARALLESLGER